MRMKTTWGNSTIRTQRWHTGHWEIMIIGDTITKKEGNFLVNCYRLMCKCVNCVHITHTHIQRANIVPTQNSICCKDNEQPISGSLSLLFTRILYIVARHACRAFAAVRVQQTHFDRYFVVIVCPLHVFIMQMNWAQAENANFRPNKMHQISKLSPYRNTKWVSI